jgi:hypothetical protein
MTATTSTTVIDDSFGVAGDAAAEGSDIGRRGILVRVSPDRRSELKIAAIRRGGTVQALLLEAIAEVLEQPDQTPTP